MNASSALAPDFASARFNMVESQIRPNKVRSQRLLSALGSVPREIFVPPQIASIAYIDGELEVGKGRYILEPMVLARLIEAGEIAETDHVLDVAPATGYSSAVLSALCDKVTALESDPLLAPLCVTNLTNLKITNAEVHFGPHEAGWSANAPYDIILVNGSADEVPLALSSQLAEGGRLLIVIRDFGPARAAHQGEARLYQRVRGALSYRALFDANVKPLPGFELKPAFSF